MHSKPCSAWALGTALLLAACSGSNSSSSSSPDASANGGAATGGSSGSSSGGSNATGGSSGSSSSGGSTANGGSSGSNSGGSNATGGSSGASSGGSTANGGSSGTGAASGSKDSGADASASLDAATEGDSAIEGCTGGRECARRAPASWTGPFQITGGTGASGLTCPNPATKPVFEGHKVASTDHVTCTACACESTTPSLDCQVAMTAWTNFDCTGTPTYNTVTSICSQLSAPGAQSLGFTGGGYNAVVSCGSPTFTHAAPLDSPPAWQDDYIGCAPLASNAGCAAGELCVSPAPSPFSQDLCVSHSDNVDCPSAFPSKTLYSGSATDTRACSDCGCQAGGDVTCSTTGLGLYSACGSSYVPASGADITDGTACLLLGDYVSNGPNIDALAVFMYPPSYSGSATCTAEGGQAIGAVTPQDPITVCCAAPNADAGSGSDANQFSLLGAVSPPGTTLPKASWGGVEQFSVASDGKPFDALVGIQANQVADPSGLAFRTSSSELFVGNRHGNNSGDGLAGSVSRFSYDTTNGHWTQSGAVITGNGLAEVGQVVFGPTSGALFAANGSGTAVSKFTFDTSGTAVAAGTLGPSGGSALGLAISPDEKTLYMTTTRLLLPVISQIDIATKNVTPFTTTKIASGFGFLAVSNGTLYAPSPQAGTVLRLTIGADDKLTMKDTIAAQGAEAVAFSPDGQEMFVAGTSSSSPVIWRFAHDAKADTWTATTSEPAGATLGGIVAVP